MQILVFQLFNNKVNSLQNIAQFETYGKRDCRRKKVEIVCEKLKQLADKGEFWIGRILWGSLRGKICNSTSDE